VLSRWSNGRGEAPRAAEEQRRLLVPREHEGATASYAIGER